MIIALYLNISGCIELPHTYSYAGGEMDRFVGKWKDEQNTIIFNSDRNVEWINNNISYPLKYRLTYQLTSNELELYNENASYLFTYEFMSDNKRLILKNDTHGSSTLKRE